MMLAASARLRDGSARPHPRTRLDLRFGYLHTSRKASKADIRRRRFWPTAGAIGGRVRAPHSGFCARARRHRIGPPETCRSGRAGPGHQRSVTFGSFAAPWHFTVAAQSAADAHGGLPRLLKRVFGLDLEHKPPCGSVGTASSTIIDAPCRRAHLDPSRANQ